MYPAQSPQIERPSAASRRPPAPGWDLGRDLEDVGRNAESRHLLLYCRWNPAEQRGPIGKIRQIAQTVQFEWASKNLRAGCCGRAGAVVRLWAWESVGVPGSSEFAGHPPLPIRPGPL